MKHAPSHSSSTTSTTAKGSRGRYKTTNRRDANKSRDGLKLVKHLEKRKEWRIKTYRATPQAQLSRTTLNLFKKWGVELVGPKATAPVVKPVVHKRWGRPQ